MIITLVGFMGTGKTVVGRLLARRLKRRFIDVDKEIERRERRTIAQIFSRRGEAAFRRIERAVIAEIVQRPHVVIATGGGAMLTAANVAVLKQRGPVICLKASVDTIMTRAGRKRPVPVDPPQQSA